VCTPSKSIHPPCFVIGLQCFRGRARSQGSRVVNLAEGWVHPGHDLVTELHRSRPKSTVSKARWSNHLQHNHTRNLPTRTGPGRTAREISRRASSRPRDQRGAYRRDVRQRWRPAIRALSSARNDRVVKPRSTSIHLSGARAT
jgi:hypothetical protein